MANEIHPNTPGYTTVSIYDQNYHLRGQDPNHIRQLAIWLTAVRAVAAQGRAISNSARRRAGGAQPGRRTLAGNRG